MKEISELNFPEDLRYTEDHEWARYREGGTIRIGLSDYAQDQLGDIVYVELPEVGTRFSKAHEFGTVESVKAVSELYMPIDGEVVAVNFDLAETPGLVNSGPYDGGWMIDVKHDKIDQLNELMDNVTYFEKLKG